MSQSQSESGSGSQSGTGSGSGSGPDEEPTRGGPSDEQLPGDRGEGQEAGPEDAEEDDGTGSPSGAG